MTAPHLPAIGFGALLVFLFGVTDNAALRAAPESETAGKRCVLSVEGNRFRVNETLVDVYGIRCASAIGTEAYTSQLIAQLDDYKAHGVNTVTVFYMGSSGGHYDPFTPDGKGWRLPEFRDRMDRIIAACAAREMIVIVGIFYQWKDQELAPRSLSGWAAAKEAVQTVARHLRSTGCKNVILNIANEQNSRGYGDEPWGRVSNVRDLLELVAIAKSVHPDLVVGCGGYDHQKNVRLGNADAVDVLLFDTLGPDKQKHSGHWHDHFVAKGVDDKPIVNVEMFGAWTRQFAPPGVYPTGGREEHYREIADAAARPGLSVFFHSNPWCQGPSMDAPVRYDLGGDGSLGRSGIRWWFERVRETIAAPVALGRLIEQGGELVIEAENHHAKSPSTYRDYAQVHHWKRFDDRDGFSGTGFMQVLPDERPETGKGPSSPRDNTGAGMSYRIRISKPGTYKVFVRGWSMGGESNGIHIGVDGKLAGKGAGASNMSGFRPHRQWIWEEGRKEGYAEPATLQLDAGHHVLHVWNRDDAFRLDKLVLSLSGDKPRGPGPVESGRE